MLVQYTATITTNGSGAATVYLGDQIRGQLIALKYMPGTIATGATLTITSNTDAQAILTKASAGTSNVWYYPMAVATKVADGSASTVSEVPIWLYKDKIKVVVASGGATATGSIMALVDEGEQAW